MQIKNRLQYAYEYIPKCHNLLDIGCDYGDFSKEYLKKAKKVYAIDPNEKVIKIAKQNNKEVIFKVAPAEKLPFPDSFFDVITMTDVFEHVQNEKKTIEEMYRVMKPGGALIFSVPHKGLFQFIDAFNMKFYFPKLYKYFKGKKYNSNIYNETPWHRHYSLKELKKFFKNKFAIEKEYSGGFLIYPIFWLIQGTIYWKLFKQSPKLLLKIHNFISDLDYSINYGKLAFHIVLKAKCLKSKFNLNLKNKDINRTSEEFKI